MKKLKIFILIALTSILTLSTVACGKPIQHQKNNKETKSKFSVEQIYDQTTETMKKITSVSFKKITEENNNGGLIQVTELNSQMTISPEVALYETFLFSDISCDETCETIIEKTIVDDQFFFNVDGEWNTDISGIDAINQLHEMVEEKRFLRLIDKQYLNDAIVMENDESYIIRMEKDNKELIDVIEDTIGTQLLLNKSEEYEYDVSKLKYKVIIDKKSYHILGINSSMNLVAKKGSEEVKIKLVEKSTDFEYNNVNKIKVPDIQ
ncbi:DUF6612 family protein [Gottfriedia solisilvae]|uniref:Lipoprotein n=1 Tax=Gottfriedia solisilvae TaxID=1516104 RepID=A0A8J3F2J5_9BACI|nr:DUF6612 family protein [Gottfriedia solisilvae]GGI17791.1 hypothetical protein GCM10007380_39700 [Gottfriedia solisilvae]